MVGVASIAEVASLIGDPARANMLFALKDDEHISVGDLSAVAGVAPSTASEHLAKLTQAGLVKMTAQGRRRYYSLADPAVAMVLEGVEGLAGTLSKRNPKPLRWDQAMIHPWTPPALQGFSARVWHGLGCCHPFGLGVRPAGRWP